MWKKAPRVRRRRSAFPQLPSRHRRGKGSCRGHFPLSPATSQLRNAAAARTSAALQVPAQQLGREPGGRRLQPRRPAPPSRSPRRAGSAHTTRRARSFAPGPLPPARGSCRLTAEPALTPIARSLPPPRRMAAASGQRRFLAAPLTVRWAFETGPGADLSRCPTQGFGARAPLALPLARLPHVLGCPQTRIHPHSAKPLRRLRHRRQCAWTPIASGTPSRKDWGWGSTCDTTAADAPRLFRAILLAKNTPGR